jgi:chitinase
MEMSQGNSLCFKQIKKCHFANTEDRKTKQVLSGGWHQWQMGGYKERVKEDECGGILCTHV